MQAHTYTALRPHAGTTGHADRFLDTFWMRRTACWGQSAPEPWPAQPIALASVETLLRLRSAEALDAVGDFVSSVRPGRPGPGPRCAPRPGFRSAGLHWRPASPSPLSGVPVSGQQLLPAHALQSVHTDHAAIAAHQWAYVRLRQDHNFPKTRRHCTRGAPWLAPAFEAPSIKVLCVKLHNYDMSKYAKLSKITNRVHLSHIFQASLSQLHFANPLVPGTKGCLQSKQALLIRILIYHLQGHWRTRPLFTRVTGSSIKHPLSGQMNLAGACSSACVDTGMPRTARLIA